MSKLSTLLCFVVSGLVMVAQADAAEPVLVTEADTEMSLGLHLEYLEDKEGTLTLEDVLKPEMASQFVKSQVEIPNLGLGLSSAYWFSFVLTNPGLEAIHRFVEVGYPLLDDIQYYRITESAEHEHFQLGDKFAFSTRPVDHRNFVVPMSLPPGELVRVLMRIETSSSFRVPVVLWEPESFFTSDADEVTIESFYFGIMFVMALYNLFVFISIRSRAYLYYVVFVTATGLVQAGLSAFTFQYLWSDSPWWAGSSLMLFLGLAICFAGLFTCEFLRLSQAMPRLDRAITIVSTVAFLLGISSMFLPYAVVVRLVVVTAIPASIFWLWAGFAQWRRGVVEAQIYVVAWLTFIVGAMVLALTSSGIVSANMVTSKSHQIGGGLLVVLLSFALARTLRTLKEEAERLAQDLTIKSKELVIALDQAQSADKLKGEILANLSHELRTPLNAIINVPKMLSKEIEAVVHFHCAGCGSTFQGDGEEGKDEEVACPECGVTLRSYSQFQSETEPEEVVGLLAQTARSGQHLAKTISDMLEFAKLESGNTPISKKSIASRSLLDEVSTKLFSVAHDKGVGISVDFPEGELRLHVDGEKVDVLFQKLIENAIEFSPPDAWVAISGSVVGSGATLRISVRDEGPGIAAGDQETIFESFRQLEGGHTRSHPGVGLGLSIAASIAEAHGTTIEVDSEPGKGSTFSVELPLEPEKVS